MKLILTIPKVHFDNDEVLDDLSDDLLQHCGGLTMVGAAGVWRADVGSVVSEPVVVVHACYQHDHEHDAKVAASAIITRLHDLGEKEVFIEWYTRSGWHHADSVKQGEVWYG